MALPWPHFAQPGNILAPSVRQEPKGASKTSGSTNWSEDESIMLLKEGYNPFKGDLLQAKSTAQTNHIWGKIVQHAGAAYTQQVLLQIPECRRWSAWPYQGLIALW